TDEYKKILAGYGLSPESIKAAADGKVADLCAGK
ncbi:MAG: ectoine/hydroxyectoine ABC transporter substrate-binding protein EhuB, partial [Starkeya sp.]|nr:ectoine/hydroxyectoine ABC transporter substrate-binding protein EhuB [Starkeya sp.]